MEYITEQVKEVGITNIIYDIKNKIEIYESELKNITDKGEIILSMLYESIGNRHNYIDIPHFNKKLEVYSIKCEEYCEIIFNFMKKYNIDIKNPDYESNVVEDLITVMECCYDNFFINELQDIDFDILNFTQKKYEKDDHNFEELYYKINPIRTDLEKRFF